MRGSLAVAHRQPAIAIADTCKSMDHNYIGSVVCDQAFTPIVTMVALFIAGLETPTRRLITAVVLIASGTAMASYGVIFCGPYCQNPMSIHTEHLTRAPARVDCGRRQLQSAFPCLHRCSCFAHHHMKVMQGPDRVCDPGRSVTKRRNQV